MSSRNLTVDTLLSRKGILAAGEFDETGRLKAYRSKTLSPEQADSTARLSGALMSLVETITALYSRFCGVPIEPLQGLRLEGIEYTLMLVCTGKTCLGIIGKNSEMDFESLRKDMI